MNNNNFGIKVWVKFSNGNSAIYRNVTEIHYNSSIAKDIFHTTAFESDVHSTGFNEDTKNISEFETRGVETEIAENFVESVSIVTTP